MTARSAPRPLGAGATSAKPGEPTFCYEAGPAMVFIGWSADSGMRPRSLRSRSFRAGRAIGSRPNRAMTEAVAEWSPAQMVTALIAMPASISEPNRFDGRGSPGLTRGRP